MNELKSQIIQALHRSFPKTPIPIYVIARGDETSEARMVQAFFEAKQWDEISLQALQNDYSGDGSACLWFMAPDAVAYYLPAYLEICVQSFRAADMIAVSTLARIRETAEGSKNNIAAGIERLDSLENSAIAQFLRYVAEHEDFDSPDGDAAAALRLRWQRFL